MGKPNPPPERRFTRPTPPTGPPRMGRAPGTGFRMTPEPGAQPRKIVRINSNAEERNNPRQYPNTPKHNMPQAVRISSNVEERSDPRQYPNTPKHNMPHAVRI